MGSLIFVVIVATWAVYLLQHWIRRREHAAASDSVRQFSEAMRVLPKRTLVPEPTTGAASSRSARPLTARRRGDRRTLTDGQHLEPARSLTDEVAVMSSSPTTGSARREPPEPRGGRAPRPVALNPTVGPWRRRARGALLLLSLFWVPTSVVLAALHVLLWVSVLLAVLTVVAVLAWLRLEVRADRAHAQADRARGASARRSRRGAGRRALSTDDTQEIHPPGAESVAAGPARAARPAAAAGSVHQEAGAAAYDLEAEIARDATLAPVPQPAAEGTWSPVPVPPPTYTMKAKAEPRMTPAGVPADVFATPEFADEADELAENATAARRAANL